MIRKLCDVADLPGEGRLKAFIDGRPGSSLALCVGVLGSVPYAVDNSCPHQWAPLSAGRLDDGYVICPLHAFKWRLTDGEPYHRTDPVLWSFELRQYGDEVFVRLPSTAYSHHPV